MELDFEIDKITESIENAETGETLDTLVLPVTKADLKEVTKKNGWLFDWKFENDQTERQVYKLVAKKEPQTIHGLVSLEKLKDHVFMHLIENAPFNIGKTKKYIGVAGNLTAYGCKLSNDYGFGGVIAFISKTALIPHYEKTLGAVHLGGNRMGILEENARKLIDKYF
jgi:ribosomal protein S8